MTEVCEAILPTQQALVCHGHAVHTSKVQLRAVSVSVTSNTFRNAGTNYTSEAQLGAVSVSVASTDQALSEMLALTSDSMCRSPSSLTL